jgi:hypothetical protein
MRVVGVTTTLTQEQMAGQQPDAIRPGIADISVDTLRGLEYAAGQADAAEEQLAQRQASNAAAGPLQEQVRA